MHVYIYYKTLNGNNPRTICLHRSYWIWRSQERNPRPNVRHTGHSIPLCVIPKHQIFIQGEWVGFNFLATHKCSVNFEHGPVMQTNTGVHKNTLLAYSLHTCFVSQRKAKQTMLINTTYSQVQMGNTTSSSDCKSKTHVRFGQFLYSLHSGASMLVHVGLHRTCKAKRKPRWESPPPAFLKAYILKKDTF